MQRLRDVGEFGLIDRISKLIVGQSQARVVLGPGDDAAVVRPPPGRDLVVSTDSFVEDVHFRWGTEAATNVGRRALVANLSDLAAMGAAPLGCVAALCAPPELELARAEGLVRGLVREGKVYGCPLLGGNVASGRETSLSITVFGAVEKGRALRRHAVRVGDRVFVTGTLGGAALAVARAEREGAPIRRVGAPRLAAGRALVRLGAGVGGCIDVSDGLVSDLAHLLERSGLGAAVESDRVPRPRGFRAACERLGVDADALALAGGEDYELLFTLRPATAGRLPVRTLSRRLGVPVAEIGRVVREPGLSGVPEQVGWRHF